MKKTLAIALAAAMILVLLPGTALAATAVTTAAELTDALAAGGEIELGANIDAGELVSGSFFSVASGKTVTLDLKGCTLEGTFTGTSNSELVSNAGTMTIRDSVGGGQLVVNSTADAGWSAYCTVISNSGTLNVESGTILNNGITSMSFAVDNRSGSGSPVLNVSGGLLKSVSYIAIRQFTNSVTQTNAVNITGGTVYGYRRGIWIQQPNTNNGLGTLTITGGKVEALEQSAVMANLLGLDGVDIIISGGELVNHSDTRATLSLMLDTNPSAGGGNAVITGGTFLNTGSAGNLSAEGADTVIAVSAGTFSAPVPGGFIAEGADPDDILDGITDVIAGVDPTYTIVIPTSVDFGTLAKGMGTVSRPFSIAASDMVLEAGARVDITVASDFTMSGSGASLPYALYNTASGGTALINNALFAFFDEDGTRSGRVDVNTDAIVSAGDFEDTMVFTITYISVD